MVPLLLKREFENIDKNFITLSHYPYAILVHDSWSLHWYFGDPFSSVDNLRCLSGFDFLLNRDLHLTQLKISPIYSIIRVMFSIVSHFSRVHKPSRHVLIESKGLLAYLLCQLSSLNCFQPDHMCTSSNTDNTLT